MREGPNYSYILKQGAKGCHAMRTNTHFILTRIRCAKAMLAITATAKTVYLRSLCRHR